MRVLEESLRGGNLTLLVDRLSSLQSPAFICNAYQFVIKPANFNYNMSEVEHFSASPSSLLSTSVAGVARHIQ